MASWTGQRLAHTTGPRKSRLVKSDNRRVGIKNLREVHVPEWMEQQTSPGEECRVHAACGCWSIPAEKHSEKDQGEGHQHGWKLRDGDDNGSRLGWVQKLYS